MVTVNMDFFTQRRAIVMKGLVDKKRRRTGGGLTADEAFFMNTRTREERRTMREATERCKICKVRKTRSISRICKACKKRGNKPPQYKGRHVSGFTY